MKKTIKPQVESTIYINSCYSCIRIHRGIKPSHNYYKYYVMACDNHTILEFEGSFPSKTISDFYKNKNIPPPEEKDFVPYSTYVGGRLYVVQTVNDYYAVIYDFVFDDKHHKCFSCLKNGLTYNAAMEMAKKIFQIIS